MEVLLKVAFVGAQPCPAISTSPPAAPPAWTRAAVLYLFFEPKCADFDGLDAIWAAQESVVSWRVTFRQEADHVESSPI